MGYPLRWNRPDLIYEVTIDTIQGRYLLRPTPEVRDLVLGVLSRAQERYPTIRLYGFFFARSRATLLLSASDERELSPFMGYVQGNISRKLGRLLDWSGKLWAGRYRSAPILDEDALVHRLRALMSQGVDEGLIESPRAWPGATCAPGLLGAMALEGAWIDRDREARLRAAGVEPPPSAYVRPYRVVLAPIPPWAQLPASELAARHRALLDDIELEHRLARSGPVMDPVELQQQDPFARPATGHEGRLRRLIHATCATLREGFRIAYGGFCATFRAAAEALRGRRRQALLAGFPEGSAPRPALQVPSSRGAAPWWSEAPASDLETVRAEPVTSSGADDVTSPWRRVGRRRPWLHEVAPWLARPSPPAPPAPPASPARARAGVTRRARPATSPT